MEAFSCIPMSTSAAQSVTEREVELKLEISPSDLDRIAAAVRQMGIPAGDTALTSVYFDTPEQAVWRSGLSLRVRHDGDRRVQTVKADGGRSAGVFDRPEWEYDIVGDTPDLTDSRGALVESIGRKALRRLAPVFRSEVTRTGALAESGDTAIELVIDHGMVATDAVSMPVCEVELELKHGDVAQLFALARQLDEVAAVRLGVLSKAQRGYLLLAKSSAGPAKAEPVLLESSMSPAEAFVAIAWSCVRHYRLNEAVLTATGDANALHQARVALRRLRSAFTLFRPIVADDRHARLRIELRWLAAVLGDARNLDVLIERTRDPNLLERLEHERVVAYCAVKDALASVRARRLMLDLAEWLTVIQHRQPADHHDRSVLAFAIGRLRRLRKRLKTDGAVFTDLSDSDRHEVRIEAKKLRYATEFFTSLFPGKKAKRRLERFRSALESFQGILGDLGNLPADHDWLVDKAVATYVDLIGVKKFW